MFTKYEDLLSQNITYITTYGRGVRASHPVYRRLKKKLFHAQVLYMRAFLVFYMATPCHTFEGVYFLTMCHILYKGSKLDRLALKLNVLKRPQLIFQIFFSWVWYDPHLTYFGWPSKVKLFLRGCEHQGAWLCPERFLLQGREHSKPETLVSFGFNPRAWPSNSSAIRVPFHLDWTWVSFGLKCNRTWPNMVKYKILDSVKSKSHSRLCLSYVSCQFYPNMSVIKPAKYREIQGIQFFRFPALYKYMSVWS